MMLLMHFNVTINRTLKIIYQCFLNNLHIVLAIKLQKLYSMSQSLAAEFIDSICHYKQQDDNMCAQHCLNALIQQPHFHAVTLAEIATQLDAQEREQYLQGGADSVDFLRSMQVVIHTN